jgi:hypothetical protein
MSRFLGAWLVVVALLGLPSSANAKQDLLHRVQRTQSIDITNREQEIAAFLDVSGEKERSGWIYIDRVCTLTVEAARGTGFTVAYKIYSENGSVVLASLMGTQTRPRQVELPRGHYRFSMIARRNAGYYRFNLITRCD